MKPEHLYEYCAMGSYQEPMQNAKDIYPFYYLEYAKEDIEDGKDKRNIINAVGNAKRAFHFQVDIICDTFAWSKINGKKSVNFPKKLEYLGSCGILSPNILKKLNTTRNKVEHDYHIPSIDEVEDYIDIVELFLMATNKIVYEFPTSFDLELMEDEDKDQTLNLPKMLCAEIKINEGEFTIKSDKESRSFIYTDIDFYDWLKILMQRYLR